MARDRRREPPRRPELRAVAPHVAGRVPPHNLDAEAAVLGAVMLSVTALEAARGILAPEHFYSQDNGRIFSAALAVADEGRPVDLVTVAGKLRDLGLVERVGGLAYVAQFVDATPAVGNVATHAELVLSKWRSRSLIALAHASIAEAYEADPVALATAHAAAVERLATGRAAVPALADQVRGMLAAPLPRLSTGVAALDLATRGGIPTGRVVVLAGAPGAGKTTFAVQFAHETASRGIPVAILAADEPGEGIRIRLGQLSGLNRDDLEARDPLAIDHLASCCEGELASLALVDQEEHGQLLEAVAADLARRCRVRVELPDGTHEDRPGPGLLVCDSIQKLRVAGSDEVDTPRAKVDLVADAIVRIAKRHHILVVATSEVSRAFYRGGDEREPNALAAGKDSGAVEYGADLLLVLRSIPEGQGDIDVDVPKNRLGHEKPTFRMRIDHARARMTPLQTAHPTPKGDRQAAVAAREESQIERVKHNVLEALVKSRVPVHTRQDLARMVAGKRTLIETAITRLLAEGGIVRLPDASRKQGVVLCVSGTTLPIASHPTSHPTSQGEGAGAGPRFPSRAHAHPEGVRAAGSGVLLGDFAGSTALPSLNQEGSAVDTSLDTAKNGAENGTPLPTPLPTALPTPLPDGDAS
jgi:replicative DNA helicase